MTLSHIAQKPEIADLIRRAIAEDVGSGDATSLALVPADRRGKALLLSRGRYIISGTEVAAAVFAAVEPASKCTIRIADGETAEPQQEVLAVEGPVRGLLTAERTALNFMQRMTGIATLTRQFVDRVKPYGVRILDTRKTTPTLRVLEKHAVLCGGGKNHRMGLYDMVLIKDNHRQLWQHAGAVDLQGAIAAARRMFPGLPVEVEVESEAELANALQGKPDWILLDNRTPAQLRRCVELCGKRCRLEASGGVTLANVEAIAATGIDAISIGALTHSAPAADLTLELAEG
jgi:nicotinate-nucleotide pyrophosphorylase (carboxylating)